MRNDEEDDNRRGRFTEAGDEGYEGLFNALNRAIELKCDESTQSAISDAYRHLTDDCIPDGCEMCEEDQ
ncbi:MAG TPA: hypothetical protein VGQ76_04885 [Thermoanaerobaculia bacterium]|jgi:hypothetical protein|nr:hypothetical protein [Thermoanaerobaculia bacterium]